MNVKTTLKTLLFCVICFNTYSTFAQTEKGAVWVTVDNPSILKQTKVKGESTITVSSFKKLVDQFNITGVALAFPSAKSEKLRKVYEIQCNCNQAYLSAALENSVPGISKPQEVPTYELMYTPNDYNAKFATDYALDLINAKGAWDISKGDPSIVFGISDANFVETNAELVGKVLYLEPDITNPNVSHGTAVAAAAAGNTDNGIGKSSIGFNCMLRLYSMGYDQILQASYDGVKVINMSWASGCSVNSYCQDVIDEIHANGTIMVASAGNGGTCGSANQLVYPSAYNHVISVTSIGLHDNHEYTDATGAIITHQHNPTVDLSAPGYSVPVVGPHGNFFTGNGTSFAAPYVTGTIGLMLAVNPCLTAEDVEYILKETSTNIDAQNPNYKGLIGAGRLNAGAAVKMAKSFSKLRVQYDQKTYVCQNQTGSVELTGVGGFPPYTFKLNNRTVGSNVDSLPLGNHTVMLTDSKGCIGDTSFTMTSLGEPPINFDYTSNLLITSPITQLSDQNGDGIIKIKGNVTIDSGVNYSIETKRIEFGYNGGDFSGFIINNGATLSITKNTSLKSLSSCKTIWDGILISDNKNTGSPGKLILDKVNIYDSKTAVKTKEVALADIKPSLKYGTFSISNSVFTDNQVGVKVLSNQNGTETNTISKTIFLLEDSSILNPIHVDIENTTNLVLLKNRFFGNDKVVRENRGTAILAKNSKLYIAEDLTTNLMEIPTDGNQFYNLNIGIKSENTNGVMNNVQITGSYFTKVNQSVNIGQNSTGIIYNNEIDVPVGENSVKSYGIQLAKNSSMVVTDNTFSTTNLSANNQFGVILTESDTSRMDVYRNRFTGNFTAANLFEGKNLKTFVDCNSYSGNNDNHWLVSFGKLGDQSGVDVNGQSLIYKNEFTPCNGNNPQISIADNAEGFVYQSKAIYMPTDIATKVVKTIITTNAEDNQCRNFFDPTPPIFNKDEVVYGVGASVFPNPTINNSAVTWNQVDIDQISVYTANGELVSNTYVTGNQGSHEINNLESGVYFIKLSYQGYVFKTDKLAVSK